jgi:hypothetical protein
MSKDREQEEVAEWFRQLRQTEESEAPPFDEVWEVARFRSARSKSRRLYYSFAAVAALFACLTVPALWWQSRRQGTGLTAVRTTSISQWKSPTDFLIDTPGQKLLKTVPRIGDGLIDMKPMNGEEKR